MYTQEKKTICDTIARSPIQGREDEYYYTEELVIIDVYDRPHVAIALASEGSSPIWLSFDGRKWSKFLHAGICSTQTGEISEQDFDYLEDHYIDALSLWHIMINPRNPKGAKSLQNWRKFLTPSMSFDTALNQRLKDSEHAVEWRAALKSVEEGKNSDAIMVKLLEERTDFLIKCYGPWYGC